MRIEVMDESGVVRSPLQWVNKLLVRGCELLAPPLLDRPGHSDSPTLSKCSHIRKHKLFIFALASSYCVPS